MKYVSVYMLQKGQGFIKAVLKSELDNTKQLETTHTIISLTLIS